MNLNTMNVTRRTLLKGAGALGAAAALGSSLTYKPVKAFANAPERGGAGRDGRGVRPLSHVHAVRQLQFRRHHEGRCRRQHRGRPRSREQRRHAVPARQERHHERVQPAPHQSAHEAHQSREGHGNRPRLGGDHLGRGARHRRREDPRMLRHRHPQARADVQLRALRERPCDPGHRLWAMRSARRIPAPPKARCAPSTTADAIRFRRSPR